MKARTYKSLTGDVCKVSIYTEEWSEADRNLMVKYGEPEIDLGGTFEDLPLSFELPSRLVRIKTETPFTQAFDYNDFADADDRANLWASTILSRLTSAISTLRAHDDVFSGETVVVI